MCEKDNRPLSDAVLEAKLKQFFGYNTFRSYQKEIIRAVLQGKDVMAILPTGAGKSLCYQLPALLLPGTAIVISPLISLMHDQVVSLYKNDIPAAFLNSSLAYQDIQSVLQQINDYKLLYIAPERLSDPTFLECLKKHHISFFVVDEAHCISQWGHSFRGEYRKLALLKEHFPICPVMALTATATFDVEKDIQTQLTMKQPVLIKGSFNRPNLTIRIESKNGIENQLKAFLEQQGNRSGILYASTRKGVEKAFLTLQEAGYLVGRYHAGMTDQERAASQEDFLHDKVTLMVATVAFGMGVHKPDVRFIVHLDMPRSVEQYYQEIGRAGRDGLPADCLMFYNTQDLVLYKAFLDDLDDPIVRDQMRLKTNRMYRLCTSLDCRRKLLLNYFGEHFKGDCGTCDNCLDDEGLEENTLLAQKILSCVYRMQQKVGMRLVSDVLRKIPSKAVLEKGFDRLSTYGLLANLSEEELRYAIETLIQQNLLLMTEGDYPILMWTEHSRAVVKHERQVYFKRKIFQKAIAKPERYRPRTNVSLQYDEKLFEKLKALRTMIAREEQVPPYVVFSDRALQEMAVYLPQSQSTFSKINGVGPIKWVKYGERFLELIKESTQFTSLPSTQSHVSSLMQRCRSSEETVQLYQQGLSLDQIENQRQLTRATIIGHLIEAVGRGIDLNLLPLISMQNQKLIAEAIAELGSERLAPLKAKLGDTCTYEDIRLMVAVLSR